MEEPILRCQFCEEPLKVIDGKCEKCGAPLYVYEDADFSNGDEPEETVPKPSGKSVLLITAYYALLLLFPGILLSNHFLHAAYKNGRVFSDTLLHNSLSFFILFAACVLAGRWIHAEINEGTEKDSASEKFTKGSLLISCLAAALILAGINYYQSMK